MQQVVNRESVVIFANVMPTAPSPLLLLQNPLTTCRASQLAPHCAQTMPTSANSTNATRASCLISCVRSKYGRTAAASECVICKHARGICAVSASKQRATAADGSYSKRPEYRVARRNMRFNFIRFRDSRTSALALWKDRMKDDQR